MIASKQVQDSSYKAKYLILLSFPKVERALLFGVDHRYLTELIDDDGLVLDNLTRSGIACMPPKELAQEALMLMHEPAAAQVRCFSLG